MAKVAYFVRDAVRAVAGLVLGGLDREAHLLGDVAGDEAADAMGFMPTSA